MKRKGQGSARTGERGRALAPSRSVDAGVADAAVADRPWSDAAVANRSAVPLPHAERAPPAVLAAASAMSDDTVADMPEAVGAASQPPSEVPVIMIEIDPAVSGGHARNRFDLTLRGRVLSPLDIVEIKLRVDNRIVSVASLGQPERAVSTVMPDGSEARQRPFQLTLSRMAPEQTERLSFDILAQAESGREQLESFTLELDPASATPVSILAGPTRSATTFGGFLPYAVLHIERGTIDSDGNLAVDGWAVALEPILGVQISVDGTPVAAARLGGVRDDVGSAYPLYPNARLSAFNLTSYLNAPDLRGTTIRARLVCPHGFALEATIPVEFIAAAAPVVRDPPVPAAAANNGSPGFLIGSQQPTYQLKTAFRIAETPLLGLGLLAPLPAAPNREGPQHADIKMFCDTLELKSDGSLVVNGWALSAAGIAQVRVLLDNQDLGLAAFGYDRSDVGSLYPDIPMASMSGFRLETGLSGRFSGDHLIRVVVRNGRNDVKEDILAISVVTVDGAASSEPGLPKAERTEEELAEEELAGEQLTEEQTAEFRFELDSPMIAGGMAVEPVAGRLTIDGWLLCRSRIAAFEVFLDDQRLGDVHYGLARQDVGAAFPDWPDALRSGFAFHCPPRSLRDGPHKVRLTFRSHNGLAMSRSFRITVHKAEDQHDLSGIRRRVPLAEADLMANLLADLGYRPAYRFILCLPAAVDPERIATTLASLRAQAFPDWSALVLAEDDEAAAAMRTIVAGSVADLADRFSITSPADAERWNAPLADPGSSDAPILYALLGIGDEIGADALLEFAVAGGKNPDADMLYGDEVRESPVTREREPFFKPDFSPDLLFSTNYIGRPWVVTGPLLGKTGATPASLLAAGDYDLVLQCTALATRVHHLPRLLCQRAGGAPDRQEQEQAALRRALARGAIAAEVLPTPIPGTWRVRRAAASQPKVSIIIPTCAADRHIETCIRSLRELTTWPDYEIVIIDNIPDAQLAWKVWAQQSADKLVDIPDGFNWSVFNNRAAAVADGEYLLFLNDDIEITQPDWLEVMMEHAQRPEVGITGAQLLYPDGKVQHAGMFLATNGLGRHAFRFAAGDDPGYFGLALTQRNVIAVTGACMLMRRTTFEALGRFDEAHEIVNNDLDLCLRAHRAGLLTVYTPYASMIHHELASRAKLKDVFNLRHFDRSWKTLFAAGDPYFNPRLSRHADDYRPDDEPVHTVMPGAPLFRTEEIRRILVVKLDHIGDFVTALPPIRRLKRLFPRASITVLAGPASRALASLEPGIDTFIPFAFFHARSQLGERALNNAELMTLRKQLQPLRFDLAVDLRKHPSTRDILNYTGARFLAGFDYLGQFPYLDIALDWDGDRTLQRKRSHVIDDLVALVDAVGHAGEADRRLMQPIPARMPLDDLPAAVQALFSRPVVAVHPGAGNVTKQWPTAHFAALIDLLIERHDVNILLIGGPDEVEVADALLTTVMEPDAVASMAGQTSLSDLPRLLLNCVLYIGNDSGPKHIAAAIGMPTIGIHSGVVDPVEWGPLGPRAVALRRNMTCSPCYLANAEDCPRALACLRLLEPSLVYEAAALLLPPASAIAGGSADRPESAAEAAPADRAAAVLLLQAPAAPLRAKGRSKRGQPAPLPA